MTVRVIRIICPNEATEFYRGALTGYLLAMCPDCKEEPHSRMIRISRNEFIVRSVMES